MEEKVKDFFRENFGISWDKILGGDYGVMVEEKSLKDLQGIHEIVKSLPEKALVVEVGVREGQTLVFIDKLLKKEHKIGYRVVGIDLWEKCENENGKGGLTYAEVKKNLEEYNDIELIQEDSVAATVYSNLQGADLVIIDAAHGYEKVLADIKAWMPLVKEGGVMLMHDVLSPSLPGVRKACEEVFGEVNVIDKDSPNGYQVWKKR